MIYLIAALFVIFAFDGILKFIKRISNKMRRRKKNMNFFYREYIESKAFYGYLFNKVPAVSYMENVDTGQAYKYISEVMEADIINIYQYLTYSRKDKRQEFTRTFFEMKNGILVELGNTYAELLYSIDQYNGAAALVAVLSEMKMPDKKEDFEINVITQNSYGLELKPLPITQTSLDISLYYNDNFKPVDELIRKRLNQKSDKGIVLLHGLPGTGKTTYLRHLIGTVNKRVMFMSPAIAGSLTNPEFIDLLLDNPNCILIIEDAENIIMDRKFNHNSAVANLLNIGDGLLSDCLNVQIICTFNSSLTSIDNALRRKGRLIAEYEFGKLTVEKAQQLGDHLKLGVDVKYPMTLAELTNANAIDFEKPDFRPIGFKRQNELATA